MLLKRLTEADGLPGHEGEVRDIIKAELDAMGVCYTTDALGNVLAKRGSRGPVVMLAAHMDEVGLVVTGIDRSGLLRIKPIGGMDERVLVSKAVRVGKDKVPGVIGAKAIHLQEPDERERPLKIDNLYVDIGAQSKEDAQRFAKLGDPVAFATKYEENQYGVAKGKAFDDRAGCAILLDALAKERDLQINAAFTVQEEIGTRGAWVAAYGIKPDFAIVVECTAAADVPGAMEHQQPTSLGQGAAITFMDGSVIVHPKSLKALVETAQSCSIPFQMRKGTAGGTDAGRIATTGPGVPSVVIAVPCRYIHAPAGYINLADYQATTKLVGAFLDRLVERGLPI